MKAKKICLNSKINYEILSKNQLVINLQGNKDHILIDGICFELVISLMNLKKVSHEEFTTTYSEKYFKILNIKKKINTFLFKLEKLKIISIQA